MKIKQTFAKVANISRRRMTDIRDNIRYQLGRRDFISTLERLNRMIEKVGELDPVRLDRAEFDTDQEYALGLLWLLARKLLWLCIVGAELGAEFGLEGAAAGAVLAIVFFGVLAGFAWLQEKQAQRQQVLA